MPDPAVIIVFDFDQTLITTDSDIYVPTHLGSTSALAELRWTPSESSNYPTWNAQVERALQVLQADRGHGVADIVAACAALPYDDEMLEVARLGNARGFPVHIVSDSNATYISAFLAAVPRAPVVASVETNPTYVDADGRLHIAPRHVAHTCKHCPPNLCKSLVLQNILSAYATRPRVVYLGDGYGDFCPVKNILTATDIALCRFDTQAPQAQTLYKLIQRNPPRCRVEYFARGPDCLALMQRLVFRDHLYIAKIHLQAI